MPDEVFKDIIRIEGDYKPFLQALQKMKTEMQNARDAFKRLWKESGFTPEDIAKFEKAFATTTTKMEAHLSKALLKPLKQFEKEAERVATGFSTKLAVAIQKAAAQGANNFEAIFARVARNAMPSGVMRTIEAASFRQTGALPYGNAVLESRARALVGLVEQQREFRRQAAGIKSTGFIDTPVAPNAFAGSGAFYGTRAQAGRIRAGAAGIPESRMGLWESLRQEQLAIRAYSQANPSVFATTGAAPNAFAGSGAFYGTRAQVGRLNYGATLNAARPSFAETLSNFSVDGGHLARFSRVGAGLSVMTGNYGMGGGLYALANVLQSVPKLGAAASLAITGVGAAAAGAAVPIGLMVSALDMNKQLADTSTLVGNVSDSFEKFNENMLKVKTTAIDMSNKFGIGVEDTLKAFKTALSAGVDVEELEEFTNIAGTMSKALGSGLNESIDILTSFRDAYKLNMSELSEVSDVLFNTIDLGKVNVQDFQNSLGRLIPVAAAAGMSFKDVAASIITLTRTGMKPSQAVTSIGMAIESIISPSDIAAKEAKALGVELGEAALRGRPFLDFLQDLKDKTGGSGEAISSIFRESRGFRGIAGLVQNLGLYGEAYEGAGAEGTAAKAAERAMNNFSDQFAKMWSRVANIAKDAGNSMLEAITPALKGVNEILEKSDLMKRYATGDMGASKELTPEERAKARFDALMSKPTPGNLEKYNLANQAAIYDRMLKEEQKIEQDRALQRKQEEFIRAQAKVAEGTLQQAQGRISSDIHGGEAARTQLDEIAKDRIRAFGTTKQKKELEDVEKAIEEENIRKAIEKGNKAKEYRETPAFKNYERLLSKLSSLGTTESLSALDIQDFVDILQGMEQSELRDSIIRKIKSGDTKGLGKPFAALMTAQESVYLNRTIDPNDNSKVPPMLRRETLEEKRKRILEAGLQLGPDELASEEEKKKQEQFYAKVVEESLRLNESYQEKYVRGLERINEKYAKKKERFALAYDESERNAKMAYHMRRLNDPQMAEAAPGYALSMLKSSFSALSGESDYDVFSDKLKEFKSLYSSVGEIASGATPEGYDNILSYLMGKKTNNRFFGGGFSNKFNPNMIPSDIGSIEDFEYSLLGRKKGDFEAQLETKRLEEVNKLTVPSMQTIMEEAIQKISEREIKVTVDSATLQPIKVTVDHSYDPNNPKYINDLVAKLTPAITDAFKRTDRTGVGARSIQDATLAPNQTVYSPKQSTGF